MRTTLRSVLDFLFIFITIKRTSMILAFDLQSRHNVRLLRQQSILLLYSPRTTTIGNRKTRTTQRRRFLSTCETTNIFSTQNMHDMHATMAGLYGNMVPCKPDDHSPILCLPTDTSPTQHTMITTVMAPMVSASDYAFRCLVRQYCVQEQQNRPVLSQQAPQGQQQHYPLQLPLTFTQMLHASNYVRDKTFVLNHYDLNECHDMNDKLIAFTESQRNAMYNPTEPSRDRSSLLLSPPCTISTHGPVIVQLAGSDVKTVVTAAQRIFQSTNGQVTGFDLNLGCPQNIARKGNYGAFLMENHPTVACSVLHALRQSLPSHITVSAKIRLPYHPAEQISRLQQLCDTGIDFMTIHGRDYTENKTTVKHIHVHRLADAIQTIRNYRSDVPVIVNGGIEFAHDAVQLQQVTGAAAVMSSEALLERPSILSEIQSLQQSSSPSQFSHSSTSTFSAKERFYQQIKFAKDYVQWCYYMPPLSLGLGNKGGSFNVIRAHLFKFLYRYLNDAMNYDLRDWLGNGSKMQHLYQAETLIQQLLERYESLTDSQWNDLDFLSSSQYPDSTWYRRHRSIKETVFIHERIKPEKRFGDDVVENNASGRVVEVSSEERKRNIRARIEQLRQNKAKKLQSVIG